MLAYFETFGVRAAQARRRFVTLIQDLDAVALEHSARILASKRAAAKS